MPRYDNALACMRFSQKTYWLLFTAYTTAGRFTSCYKAVKAKSHYDAGGAPVRDQESTWMNRGPTGIPMLHRDEL
ncbi:hypothetical protein DPMN_153648 [Dreissena polymorpha]|uniref:Uncharacterized protein n=1 Tax=Dreissena polymorpha TaxID=45954 RepID=A0A9D4FMQ7_DREPO|nr:hypothetical protein DPMN_153648 [Dreissena polymorpha]